MSEHRVYFDPAFGDDKAVLAVSNRDGMCVLCDDQELLSNVHDQRSFEGIVELLTLKTETTHKPLPPSRELKI